MENTSSDGPPKEDKRKQRPAPTSQKLPKPADEGHQAASSGGPALAGAAEDIETAADVSLQPAGDQQEENTDNGKAADPHEYTGRSNSIDQTKKGYRRPFDRKSLALMFAGAAITLFVAGGLAVYLRMPSQNGEGVQNFAESWPQQSGKLDALQSEITKISQQVRALDKRVEDVRMDAKEQSGRFVPTEMLEEIQSSISRLQTELKTLERAQALSVQQEQSANNGAASETALLQRPRVSEDIVRRVGQLEQDLLLEKEKIAEMQDQARPPDGTNLVLMLFNLIRAIETGRPFSAELQLIEANHLQLSRQSLDDIAILTRSAKTGAVSLNQLQRDLPLAIRAMSRALPVSQESGIGGQLLSAASQFISVRKISPGDLHDPLTALGEIEMQMGVSNVEAALRAFDHLPDPAKEAGAWWAKDARGYLDAHIALQRLLTEAIGRASLEPKAVNG